MSAKPSREEQDLELVLRLLGMTRHEFTLLRTQLEAMSPAKFRERFAYYRYELVPIPVVTPIQGPAPSATSQLPLCPLRLCPLRKQEAPKETATCRTESGDGE